MFQYRAAGLVACANTSTGGALTRVRRGDVDLLAGDDLVLQLGLLLFLAAVGLSAGPNFAAQAFTATGLRVGLLAAVIISGSAVCFMLGSRLLGLSAPRAAGGFAGFVGQPAVLDLATSRSSDERVTSGYAAQFALGIIAKIIAVQVIAAVLTG